MAPMSSVALKPSGPSQLCVSNLTLPQMKRFITKKGDGDLAEKCTPQEMRKAILIILRREARIRERENNKPRTIGARCALMLKEDKDGAAEVTASKEKELHVAAGAPPPPSPPPVGGTVAAMVSFISLTISSLGKPVPPAWASLVHNFFVTKAMASGTWRRSAHAQCVCIFYLSIFFVRDTLTSLSIYPNSRPIGLTAIFKSRLRERPATSRCRGRSAGARACRPRWRKGNSRQLYLTAIFHKIL